MERPKSSPTRSSFWPATRRATSPARRWPWTEDSTGGFTDQVKPMTIGSLARRTGMPVKMLREYEDMGLIYSVGRSPGNYRLFGQDALWCVEMVRTLRGLG